MCGPTEQCESDDIAKGEVTLATVGAAPVDVRGMGPECLFRVVRVRCSACPL